MIWLSRFSSSPAHKCSNERNAFKIVNHSRSVRFCGMCIALKWVEQVICVFSIRIFLRKMSRAWRSFEIHLSSYGSLVGKFSKKRKSFVKENLRKEIHLVSLIQRWPLGMH